ncbi:alpha/beta hydrolase [Nocardioides endophyticus]|uniref:Alpha/beta hydrolase n=1 Tax=Nocardioides endophyticus TaxID=1353775 RepID=A0ABP8YTB3_9ACTN
MTITDSVQVEVTWIETTWGRIRVQSAGSGPALLYLHPAAGSSWRPFLDLLAQDYRVHVPEHPGFGETELYDGLDDPHDLAFLYLELLDALDLESVILVGSSFGGWIAAELASIAHRRFPKLVLIDAVGLRIPENPVADTFAMNQAETAAALFHDQEFAARLFAGEPTVEQIVQMTSDKAALAHYSWKPFFNNPKLEARLHRIGTPTLVLWGQYDGVVALVHGERYAAAIPNARLEVIADAAHSPLLEKPAETIALVTQFLR